MEIGHMSKYSLQGKVPAELAVEKRTAFRFSSISDCQKVHKNILEQMMPLLGAQKEEPPSRP